MLGVAGKKKITAWNEESTFSKGARERLPAAGSRLHILENGKCIRELVL